MSDKRQSELTALTSPNVADEQHIVDTSDTTDNAAGSSRRITLQNIFDYLKSLTQTLTNKTIDLTDNTVTGTTSEFNTANSDQDFATLAGTENISNKTFTDQTEFSEDVNLATGKNVQVNDVDPWRTIDIGGKLAPTTTSGCATSATVEAGTNDIDYDVLDFDTGSDESAFCNFSMPDSWDGGAIQFRYVWTNAAGLTTETVTFELSGRSYADSDAIDQAVGTAVEVADTWIAQGDIHTSAWSGDVTLAGTPAAGEWVHLEFMRDVSEDDLTGDARIMEVQIRYKVAQYSD